jgi:hypothetical protein
MNEPKPVVFWPTATCTMGWRPWKQRSSTMKVNWGFLEWGYP